MQPEKIVSLMREIILKEDPLTEFCHHSQVQMKCLCLQGTVHHWRGELVLVEEHSGSWP